MADEGTPSYSYDPAKDASAQEPLTANEQKLVTRLFGDPFAFPMEFKAWLHGWLEEQFPRIGSLSVAAPSGAAGAFVPPAGAILDYGGDSAPQGYVMCDGTEYDSTAISYQRLFNAIGFKYGTGSTGSMFKVPDFQGRVAVGKGTNADVDVMGDSDGQAVGARSVKHHHTVIETPHAHDMNARGAANGSQWGAVPTFADGETGAFQPASASRAVTTGLSVGPAGTPLDGPAFLVVNKIISLGS
jgi:microcystin-dependent protein